MARRWDSAGSGKRNTRPMHCQTSDKMELLASGPHTAPLPLHPPPRRHRPSRARVRAGPERPDRGDRRRQVDLVGAVGLLVGGRASADLVRTGEETAAVEAIFETPDGREVIVRREVSSQGRSRAFVDGALVTSASLRELCGGLVDLHGQHEHQVLLDPAAHLDLLDEFAGAAAERDAGRGTPSRAGSRCATSASGCWRRAREGVARGVPLVPARRDRSRRGRSPGEDEELAADAPGARQRRQAPAPVRRGLRLAVRRRRGGAAGARQRLEEARRARRARRALRPVPRGADSVKSQLEDLAFFLRSYASAIDASPARLQEIEDRLALLERLKKKHGPALADVIGKGRRSGASCTTSSTRPSAPPSSTRRSAGRAHDYLQAAPALSAQRRAAATAFAARSRSRSPTWR